MIPLSSKPTLTNADDDGQQRRAPGKWTYRRFSWDVCGEDNESEADDDDDAEDDGDDEEDDDDEDNDDDSDE